MAIQVKPNIWFLSPGEAGDAQELGRLGIELLIRIGLTVPAPHDAAIGWMAINIDPEGRQPVWILQALVMGIKGSVLQGRVIGIADPRAGIEGGLFLAAMVEAEVAQTSFNAALQELLGLLPQEVRDQEMPIPAALLMQGRELWPGGA